MNFEQQLSLHISRIRWLASRFYDSGEDVLSAAYSTERMAWFDIKRNLDYHPKVLLYKDLSSEEIQRYDNQVTEDGFHFPLEGLLMYRDKVVPFYDDDYGQQVFAVFEGETLPGGSYNPMYLTEFRDQIDSILDNRIFKEVITECGE